eukprot:TRINITY_DN2791_c0_g1_i1.p1 TRINITY_DN2791_c0_g1~~TRINITY_DN2791_c0_g1_i1.p1  ORF type:complete len:243 (+),score=68.23 TRINITY_DN2791_c0_g1_i1:77-730(+)
MSSSSPEPDYVFKFIIIGDSGTGKSCLLHRFIHSKFRKDSAHTVGVEFGSKLVEVGSHVTKLQIWDTAGQERFRSVTRSYYRGAAGAILVYDITNRESFNHVASWLAEAKSIANSDIVIVLVGTKLDLEADRQVSFLEASTFASENGMMFLEGSSVSGESVDEAFFKCSRSILTKIETGQINPESIGSGVQQSDSAILREKALRNKQQLSASTGCAC